MVYGDDLIKHGEFFKLKKIIFNGSLCYPVYV